MTAEQFLDAVWMITDTAPDQGRRAGAAAAVRRLGAAGAPVRPRGAGEGRRADALAGPAEPRAGGDDAAATC